MRRWMFAVAMVAGLMVGAPLLAKEKVAPPTGPNAGDVFRALAVARVNVEAAAGGVLADGKALPQEVSAGLAVVAKDVGEGRDALGSIYPKQLKDAGAGQQPVAQTKLADQVAEATDGLAEATGVVDQIEAHEGGKEMFQRAKKALDDATTRLAAVQTSLRSAPAMNSPTPAPTVAQPVATAQAPEDDMRGLVVSGLAVLFAATAILLVFLPVGPVAKLRSDKKRLEAQVASLTSQQAALRDELKSLGQQKDGLSTKVKKLADAAQGKENEQAAQEEWTTKERRTHERRKAVRAGGGASAVADAVVEPVREKSQALSRLAALDEVDEEDVPVAPVKVVPKSRVPLADYNDARAKKPADRATEFGQQYTKQTLMTCANPSARNNGPYTDLRFREDHFGKFLAVEHGKETLLFPELNYEYSTGRKTLEGVFQYPEVESATLRLTQAATLEKRGDEWALTRQGVFQNG